MKADAHRDAGSYAFGHFQRNAEELERLKLQARIALALEQEIWTFAGLASGMTVLDLGCGPGVIGCELARRTGPGGQVTGLDISEELVAVAQQIKASERVEHVTFATGNAYDLPFSDNHFDFVYARLLFQHLREPRRALDEVRRVLKPGGRLCLVDIDDNWTGFSPASESFIRFIRMAGAAQRRRGGNRTIGSQAYSLLSAADFTDVSTRIFPLTSEAIGIRAFLGVAVMFRLELLNRFQKLRALPDLRRIKAAATEPHVWGAVGIFATVGRKD